MFFLMINKTGILLTVNEEIHVMTWGERGIMGNKRSNRPTEEQTEAPSILNNLKLMSECNKQRTSRVHAFTWGIYRLVYHLNQIQ